MVREQPGFQLRPAVATRPSRNQQKRDRRQAGKNHADHCQAETQHRNHAPHEHAQTLSQRDLVGGRVFCSMAHETSMDHPETLKPAAGSTPPGPGFFLVVRMMRPGFLVITVIGCVLGLSTAAACGCGLDPWRALGIVVLAVLAHAAANVLNDYEDARNGADAANADGIFPFTGGSRLIQSGTVSEKDTRRLALALLIVLVPGGLLLAARSGAGLLGVGLAGLVLGWAYSAPPLRLMTRGLGELTVAAAWWLVVIGADYSQRGQFFVIPAAIGLSFALLVANILLINGLPDARADAAVGKYTLAVRLGPTGSVGLYVWLAVLAHGWQAVSVGLLIAPQAALWGLLSAPMSLIAAVLMWRARLRVERLRLPIVLTIGAASVHGLAMALGLAFMAAR